MFARLGEFGYGSNGEILWFVGKKCRIAWWRCQMNCEIWSWYWYCDQDAVHPSRKRVRRFRKAILAYYGFAMHQPAPQRWRDMKSAQVGQVGGQSSCLSTHPTSVRKRIPGGWSVVLRNILKYTGKFPTDFRLFLRIVLSPEQRWWACHRTVVWRTAEHNQVYQYSICQRGWSWFTYDASHSLFCLGSVCYNRDCMYPSTLDFSHTAFYTSIIPRKGKSYNTYMHEERLRQGGNRMSHITKSGRCRFS